MQTSQVYEADAVVAKDGTVRVEGVPFPTGDRVRVVIRGTPTAAPRRHSPEEVEGSRLVREGLKGSVLRYDDPFEPAVPPEEWDALR
jgi:hypothetical protein